MSFNKRKPLEANSWRLRLSEMFFFEQRVAIMLFSRESVDIFACIFFSSLTFPFITLEMQSQSSLNISSEQFKLKHLFSVRGNLMYKLTV